MLRFRRASILIAAGGAVLLAVSVAYLQRPVIERGLGVAVAQSQVKSMVTAASAASSRVRLRRHGGDEGALGPAFSQVSGFARGRGGF